MHSCLVEHGCFFAHVFSKFLLAMRYLVAMWCMVVACFLVIEGVAWYSHDT